MIHPSISQAAQENRRTALRIWALSLSTPILYLALAWLFEWLGWVDTDPQATHPWDTPIVRALLAALAAVALLVAAAARLWRARDLAHRLEADPDAALNRWTTGFYTGAGAADSAALIGFIAFVLTARHEALLLGGVAGYLGYAISYPTLKVQ